MKLIWPILKDTAIYFWEELFYLVIYNLLAFFALLPAALFWFTSMDLDPAPSPLIVVPVSLLLASVAPYLLFALFWTVYDISEGKAIKFLAFFRPGWANFKQAYIWWGINLAVLTVIAANITFYRSLETGWSVYLVMLFFGILLAWLLTQAIALTMYPRLVEPGFRLATRNALVVIARHPMVALVVGFISMILIFAGVIIRPLSWFATIALVATLLNMATRKVLQELLKPEEDDEEAGNEVIADAS